MNNSKETKTNKKKHFTNPSQAPLSTHTQNCDATVREVDYPQSHRSTILTFTLLPISLVPHFADALVGLGRVLAESVNVTVICALGAFVHIWKEPQRSPREQPWNVIRMKTDANKTITAAKCT